MLCTFVQAHPLLTLPSVGKFALWFAFSPPLSPYGPSSPCHTTLTPCMPPPLPSPSVPPSGPSFASVPLQFAAILPPPLTWPLCH